MRTFSIICKNSVSNDVVVLQCLLRSHGFIGADGKPLDIDGNFGNNTKQALVNFQKSVVAYGGNCNISGICDSKTWNALLGV